MNQLEFAFEMAMKWLIIIQSNLKKPKPNDLNK